MEIYQYQQEGQIYFWRYQSLKNYPGYQMAWSDLGKTSFIQFLRCLATSEVGHFRTLNLAKPTEEVLKVPNRTYAKVTHFKKLRIELSNDIRWQLTVDENLAQVILSPESCLKLAEVCVMVKSQVELRYEEISFWW